MINSHSYTFLGKSFEGLVRTQKLRNMKLEAPHLFDFWACYQHAATANKTAKILIIGISILRKNKIRGNFPKYLEILGLS